MAALRVETVPDQAAKVQRLLAIAADAITAAAAVKASPPLPWPACTARYAKQLEATRRMVESLAERVTAEPTPEPPHSVHPSRA